MNYRVTAVFKGLYKVDVRGEQKLFSITGNMKKLLLQFSKNIDLPFGEIIGKT